MAKEALREIFAPLEAQPVEPTRQRSDDQRQLAPAPDHAGVPTNSWLQALRRRDRFVHAWVYPDEMGRTLAFVARFDLLNADGSPKLDGYGKPKKEFLPVTYWVGPDGNGTWRNKNLRAPRPLYRLDLLEQHSSKPVLVVEGEKAADAAALLLPDLVVTTSMGGSAGAQRADWAVLAGRDVIVWPDHDQPGLSYAADVCACLEQAQAASVATVETPDGLFPPKWDLADPLPEAVTLQDLKAYLEGARSAVPELVTWPSGFRMRPNGLWHVPGGDKANLRVSSPFQVVAEGRAPRGSDWSLVLSWADRDSRSHQAVVRRADLAGDGTDVRKILADRGLILASIRGARERFTEALTGVACSTRVTIADTTGWHEQTFVLPHRSIGAGQEEVIFTGRGTDTHFAERGSLSEWQEHVAGLASEHHRLVFALAVAFTGPFLQPLGMEGGGFHTYGPSSCGKTTQLRVAGSVWGGGGELGFAQTWRNTDNALEGVAAAHNHTLLALDEIGQIDPRALGEAAYALANGEAKGRMRADTSLRRRARWRVPILSSGEITLGGRIREAGPGKKVRAGQEVRIVDVPADAGAGFGVFDHGAGQASADAIARQMKDATGQLYGTAGPAFVERLITTGPVAFEAARQLVKSLGEKLAPAGCDGQAARVAQRFALTAAAGEIAARFGILPFAEGTTAKAVERTFGAWIPSRGGGSARREDQVALQVVSNFLQRFGDSRFADWPEDTSGDTAERFARSRRVIPDQAGWRRDQGFLINMATWSELTADYDGSAIASALAARGYLKRGKDGRNSILVTVEGRKQRVYAISADILEVGDAG